MTELKRWAKHFKKSMTQATSSTMWPISFPLQVSTRRACA